MIPAVPFCEISGHEIACGRKTAYFEAGRGSTGKIKTKNVFFFETVVLPDPINPETIMSCIILFKHCRQDYPYYHYN